MESALISAGVALVVALVVQRSTTSREVAPDTRRYRMQRAAELRAAYAVAIQLARDLARAAGSLLWQPEGETASDFDERVTAHYAVSRAAYAERLPALLLEPDGAVVERLIDVMWGELFAAQMRVQWRFSSDPETRRLLDWKEILEAKENLERQMRDVIDHCRRSLARLEPEPPPYPKPPLKIRARLAIGKARRVIWPSKNASGPAT